MAARNTLVECAPGAWTQLTDNNVTNITFQNHGPENVLINVTTSTTPPAVTESGWIYKPSFADLNIALSELAPGVTSGARVWAKPATNRTCNVFVSHSA